MTARIRRSLGVVAATLVAACTFGAEISVVSMSEFTDGAPFSVAATEDGTAVFTADGANTLSAFSIDGTVLHWQVSGSDPLHAVSSDPAAPASVRALHDSGIHRVTAAPGVLTYSDTVALPVGLFSELCDVAVSGDGDLFLTAVETITFGRTVYSWTELHRYDARSDSWAAVATVDSNGDCAKVSASPVGDDLVVLLSNTFERRDPTSLALIDTTPATAHDIDLLDGVVLLGRTGSSSTTSNPHDHLQLLDDAGAILDEAAVGMQPSSVALTITPGGEIRAWAAGEGVSHGVSYTVINP